MRTVLYVYAVTSEALTPECEAVDGSRRFGCASIDRLCAVFTPVDAEGYSQEAVDARAGDLEWLGSIGYRHQTVMTELMKLTTIIPLRAFSLFSSEEALRSWLHENAEFLAKTLERLAGKQEWTFRVEVDPASWSEALVTRVDSLRAIQQEIDTAAPGRAFLLRKKLEDEKRKASADAETELLREIQASVLGRLRCEAVAETREHRAGAFPQINVLIERDEESVLHELHQELNDRYRSDGVTVALSGPWPPYTFAGAEAVQ